jgi:tetratricopeptide (TPR) repeat protein
MSFLTFVARVSVFGLLISVAALAPAQTRLKGTVRTPGNDPLIAREKVTIDGGGTYTTDDVGQFDFDLVQNLKIGQPARFHVYHVNPSIKVKQWIIVRPCDLTNGRKDSLPDVGAEPISLIVLPKGDRRLLALNADSSILGCTIEEIASEFKPLSGPAERKRGSLSHDNDGEVAGQINLENPDNKLKRASHVGRPKVVEAAYQVYASQAPLILGSEENPPQSPRLDDAALARKAEELGFTPKELAEAIDAWARAVEDNYEKGLAALYERRFAEASQLILKSIPSPPGDLLKRYVPLARAEYEQGHYAAAESFLRIVLAVHSDDPMILNNLGLVLAKEGNYAEAEPLYQRALAIAEKGLGPNHPAVATKLNNLALLYYSQGKYAEAEPLYKRALAIDEKALGPNHPDVATNLNNLALLFKSQGKYTEAEPLYQRALAIDEKALGPYHPDVATAVNNLAGLYWSQGKYAEAEQLYQRALAIAEKALGPDHPDVARNLNNLAALYDAQGEYAEAEPLYKRALAIDEKVLGPNHPDMASMLNNLAEFYRAQGKYAEAEPLYKRALAINEKALGPYHPDVASILNNLAKLFNSQGKYTEAEPLYKRALAIDEKALGPYHPDLATDLSNLAELCGSQGKYAEAELLYKRALGIAEKALGPNHPAVATIAENLALTLRHVGRDTEAKVYADQAARIRAKNAQQPRKE